MLILTRRIGEAIYIGDDIKVEVLSIDRGQVRIGFTAPRDINIWRDELTKDSRGEAGDKYNR
ncbi:MAG: carbon storage regulator CsrA [Candidatus Peribacteraceae bacterium]|nr:carbon storage regulator CsrA [Candidatus Peribacteraceae bacterium]